ncbi:ATP-binding protein [Couchioplanes caeruleus]|uniref:ATP-binding protein n=1 Tax=Couchioplanes caeruleus TaxID=56438 RepID=UPI0020BFA435|nr:ATP-binding protein [Couchioplanes caeruleus]UQU61709.1 ATP-binding protein [Couchioplanes caeruleus]
MRRRAVAGLATLILLFLAVVTVQLVAGDRLQDRHAERAERLERARDANTAALQHMTDAETGVRGFQLTGRPLFLEPYEQGRVGAFTSFDEITANTSDPGVLRLVAVERAAASQWLYAYATPVVNAGEADPGFPQTQRGKELFDQLRDANAAVDAAVRAEQATAAAAARTESRIAQLVFAGLGAVFLIVTLALAGWARRSLLAPLDQVRATLHRLTVGDLGARAVPAGDPEMQAVAVSVNRLADEVQRLLTADEARLVRADLRQAVAAAIRDSSDVTAGAVQVARLIAEALGADAVHGRISLDSAHGISACWPPDAPSLSPRTVRDVLAGVPGAVMAVPHVEGAMAVPLGGDADCPPGLVYAVRREPGEWTAHERRLLAGAAREIEHAVRQQRLQHRQARLISELRVLDERKDAFVATVTHELRTPLTSILGYTEMLADGEGGELPPLHRRSVAAILRNAHRLHDTVSDLLLLDRSGASREAGAVPVDLAAVAATVHAEIEPVARSRGIDLTGETAALWVDGDARRLGHVLRNLLGNAVKFTGTGGHVGYRLHADRDTAVVEVTDTGIGIPEADQPGLFTPFHRAANAMDQAVQGSGLGLAIVRTIVTEHGGTVQVDSKVGEGTTFTVRLPRAAVPGSS